MLLYVSAAVLALGVALMFVGVRGRRVGDDPHCRKCGFNLRGRPDDSTRCAECGADVDAETRHAHRPARRRRGKILAFGLIVTLASAGAVGWLGYQRGKTYEWVRIKPTAWVLRDLGSADRTVGVQAQRELLRRINDKSFAQAKVDRIVDHALARQADRSVGWDRRFGELIERAALVGRVDDERARRYLTQGIEVKLRAKAKLRRGQAFNIQLSVKPDRFSYPFGPSGTWSVSPLKLGNAVLDADFARDQHRVLSSSTEASTSDGARSSRRCRRERTR